MLGDFQIQLPDIPTVPSEIVLGIRPENVRLATSDDDKQIIQGKVFLVENLGMHNLVSIHVKSSHSPALTVRALLPTDQNWDSKEIKLVLPPQNIHWFDGKVW